MLNDFIKKHILKVVLIVPLILLVFVFSIRTDLETFEDSNNKYLKSLPTKFIEVVQSNPKENSAFFASVISTNGFPELVVVKKSPTKAQMATVFFVQLYPENKSFATHKDGYISKIIDNNAPLYKYKGDSYCVYRKPLPMISLDRITIFEKAQNKKQTTWKQTIDNSFKTINELRTVKEIKNIKGRKEITNPYLELFNKSLENNDISVLPYSLIRSSNDSLYKVSVDFKAFFEDNKLTFGVIKKPNLFWRYLNTKDKRLVNHIKFNGADQDKCRKLLLAVIERNQSFQSTFDLDKLAKYYALNQLFSSVCIQQLYIVFNKETNLFEPFHIQSRCLGTMSKYVKNLKIENTDFQARYIKSLKVLSDLNISEYIEDVNPDIESYLALHNSFYPQSVFDIDLLELNQRVIIKNLDQNSLIKPELLSFKKGELTVTIENLGNHPIIIKELNHKTKKTITTLKKQRQILGKSKDTLKIELPRSFQNLFVSKKRKTTEFILYKHINELFLGYSILGMDELTFSGIIPYQRKDNNVEDLFRKEVKLETDKNMVVDQQNKVITFSKKTVSIDYPLVIPSGYVFKATPGTQIDIINGGKIISHSPLNFIGTQKEDIKLFSSDKKGQGMIVFSDGIESELKFVKFLNLTNPKHGDWNVTGAITFYESPVLLTNVVIENNRCEDAINIVRTNFKMRFCRISGTQSDAFDGDFVKGNIVDCQFDNLGNDAIDISGSDLFVIRVSIINAGDKGLSAGEDSRMTVKDVQISNSEIAVAGKDLSTVTISNLEVSDTKLGFTAFQKKPEFGPSNIKVNGVEMNTVETKYLIETTSSLVVDGRKIKTAQNVKDRMYGAEFGRSSAETRNSQ